MKNFLNSMVVFFTISLSYYAKAELTEIPRINFGNELKETPANFTGSPLEISCPIPETSPISGPTTPCTQDTAIYKVIKTEGSTYFWTVPPGAQISSDPNADSIKVIFDITSGDITVKEINKEGCEGTVQKITVKLLALPLAPNIIGVTSVCEGSSNVVYTSDPYPGTTYHWTFGEDISAVSYPNYISVQVKFGAVSGAVKLRRTSLKGCFSPETVLNVEVKPKPVVKISVSSTEVCSGTTIKLNASGAERYGWTTVSGLIVNSLDRSQATAKVTTSTSYSVDGTAANGCKNQASVFVIANPLPVTSTIKGPFSLCSKEIANYYVINTLGSTYTWTVPPGTEIFKANTSTSEVKVVFGTTSGDITVKETNKEGCQGTEQKISVNLLALPLAPNIIGEESVCEGRSQVFYKSDPYPGTTYHWTFSEGISAVSYPNYHSVHVKFGAVSGAVKLRRTNLKGCSSPETVLNVEVKSKPVVNISVSGTEVCSGTNIKLNASGAERYGWTIVPGLIVNSLDRSQATATVIASTNYSVVGIDANGCKNLASVDVTAIPLPIITVDPTAPVICEGSSVTLNAAGAETYSWFGGNLDKVLAASVTVNPITTTDYYVTGTSEKGCRKRLKVKVAVSTVEVPKIIADCNILDANIAGHNYQWNLNENPISGAYAQQLTPATCGNYSVTASNQYGCSATSAPFYVMGMVGTESPSARIGNLENNNSDGDIVVYPNPNRGNFSIKTNAKLVVRDVTGKVVYENVVRDLSELENVDLGEIPSGSYMVLFMIGDQVVSRKILVY